MMTATAHDTPLAHALSEEVLLEVQNLEVTYDRVVTAVRGISLNVRRGSITGIIGTNGAGKTTTLHAIAGLGIGLVPERRKIFSTLTVEENLRASIAGRSKKRKELLSLDDIYKL